MNGVWPGESSGIIAKLWAGIKVRIPVGYQNETCFHYGTESISSFASLGEEVYDDYWMFYLTRPYMNLKTYLEYKKRGVDALRAHEKEISKLAEDEAGKAEHS